MLMYYLMYLIPSIAVLNYKGLPKKNTFAWIAIGTIYTLLIGWRHEIGGDWPHYLRIFENVRYETFNTVLRGGDPGYNLLNYIVMQFGFDIYTVNFICAIIFVIGLIKLARDELNPWMVISVAVPYTILVVAMGYTRQGVALGFIMWALVQLKKKNMVRFFILIALASTFHKSAVLMVGLGIFTSGGGSRLMKILAVGFIGLGLYNTFLASYTDTLVKNYVDAQMQSSGALIRTFMNLIPALLFLKYRKQWKSSFVDYGLWYIMSIVSILSFIFVGVASTAVDRMALYLLPIQMVVFSRLSFLMKGRVVSIPINTMILIYYALVLTGWLNFATYSYLWLPYQNYLWYDLF